MQIASNKMRRKKKKKINYFGKLMQNILYLNVEKPLEVFLRKRCGKKQLFIKQ